MRRICHERNIDALFDLFSIESNFINMHEDIFTNVFERQVHFPRMHCQRQLKITE